MKYICTLYYNFWEIILSVIHTYIINISYITKYIFYYKFWEIILSVFFIYIISTADRTTSQLIFISILLSITFVLNTEEELICKEEKDKLFSIESLFKTFEKNNILELEKYADFKYKDVKEKAKELNDMTKYLILSITTLTSTNMYALKTFKHNNKFSSILVVIFIIYFIFKITELIIKKYTVRQILPPIETIEFYQKYKNYVNKKFEYMKNEKTDKFTVLDYKLGDVDLSLNLHQKLSFLEDKLAVITSIDTNNRKKIQIISNIKMTLLLYTLLLVNQSLSYFY